MKRESFEAAQALCRASRCESCGGDTDADGRCCLCTPPPPQSASSLHDVSMAGRSPIGPGGLAELQSRLAVKAIEACDWGVAESHLCNALGAVRTASALARGR